MKVYFVRHGQTFGNLSEVHQDHSDELNERGVRQAKTVAKRFESIDLDCILSSDFSRARATADEIAQIVGKEVEVTELLRERKRPSVLVGKRYDSEEVLSTVKEMETKKHLPDYHHSDEENHTEALERAQKLLRFLEQRREENIVVVTHAAYMRFILTCMIFGKEATVQQFEKIYDAFRVHNTGITVCKFGEGMRGLYKKDKYWWVVTWNDHAHLGELK